MYQPYKSMVLLLVVLSLLFAPIVIACRGWGGSACGDTVAWGEPGCQGAADNLINDGINKAFQNDKPCDGIVCP